MNAKENILATFEKHIPERVPGVIYGGGVWTMHNSGNVFENFIGKPEAMARLIIETNEKVGSDMVFPGSGYNNLHAAIFGGKIKWRKIGAPDLEEPIVNTIDDIKRLDLGALEKDEIVQTVWKASELVSKEIGNEILVGTTAWGPFTLAAQFLGAERLMRGTFKEKELVHELLRFTTEVLVRFYQPMIEGGYMTTLALADPVASGDLVSKKQFKDFALPYLRELSDRVHAMGALVFCHICGDTHDRLELFPESGVDVIALDYKVDMARAKAEIGDKMCLAGNSNPVTVLNNGTPDECVASARESIEKAGDNGSFILLPGCDIPPTVPLVNIQAYLQSGKKYRYENGKPVGP